MITTFAPNAGTKNLTKNFKENKMAVPKRRNSKTRGAKRRTHYKIKLATVVKCSNCGAYKRPHRACPSCGEY